MDHSGKQTSGGARPGGRGGMSGWGWKDGGLVQRKTLRRRRDRRSTIMARKSALQKIEDHEKLCRIMQRQTFEQIKELKLQIVRIERLLIGTAAFVIISLLDKVL